MKRLETSPNRPSTRCLSRGVPRATVPRDCVSPRVNSAEPFAFEQQSADCLAFQLVKRRVELLLGAAFRVDVRAFGKEVLGQRFLQLVGGRVPLLLTGILLQLAQLVQGPRFENRGKRICRRRLERSRADTRLRHEFFLKLAELRQLAV